MDWNYLFIAIGLIGFIGGIFFFVASRVKTKDVMKEHQEMIDKQEVKINELQEEVLYQSAVKNANAETITNLIKEMTTLQDTINNQKVEITFLKGLLDGAKQRNVEAMGLSVSVEQVKAEAIKEFAERLIEEDGICNHTFDDCASILLSEEYRKGREEKIKEIRLNINILLEEMECKQ